MDPDRPAPGRLEIVRHVLNSDDRYHGLDHAGDDIGLLNRYLARLEPRYTVASASELDVFRTFRATVRQLLLAPDPTVFHALNQMAEHYPMTIWLDETGSSSLRATGAGDVAALPSLVSDALAGIHEAMLTGHWSRLRACQRFDCSWIYYDATSGTTMRWCSTDPCGNVMKTRAYRARMAKRQAAQGSSD